MNSRMLQKYLFPFPMLEEEEDNFLAPLSSSDLAMYEDDKNIFVEAALPGLSNEEVDVTFHKGILVIRGSKKEEEEDKKRKYYRKANRTYTYRVSVPGNIDETAEPSAEFKNGVMKVSFPKMRVQEPKKIQIKNG